MYTESRSTTIANSTDTEDYTAMDNDVDTESSLVGGSFERFVDSERRHPAYDTLNLPWRGLPGHHREENAVKPRSP